MRSIWVVCASILVACLCAEPRRRAPADLNLSDVNGKHVRLRDCRGRIVVLNFSATWCIPCRREMPLLAEAANRYGPRGVVFIGASLDDAKTRRHVPAFLSEYGIGFSVWMGATSADLARLGMGDAVPATAFLDPKGHIVARILGQMRKPELSERIDWLLGGGSGPAPQELVTHLAPHLR